MTTSLPPSDPATTSTVPGAGLEDPSIGYIPGLDGIRALAVLGVMANHGGVPWFVGGFLGVDAFFVLSGFLITTLLLREWDRLRRIRLGAFWARRARRLLPALLMVILFVALYEAVLVPRGTYPDLRLDALSSLFYVANWHFILIGSNYFNANGLASPLTHTWSLAIEEQFYVVWPIVVLLVMKLTRSLRTLLWVCLCGVAASAIEMAVLFRPGTNPTRLYYGTDTHGQCLLVGATVAVVLAMVANPRSRVRALQGRSEVGWSVSARTQRVLAGAGLAGFALCAVLWSQVNGYDAFLYRGGFLVAALASSAVLVCVVCAPRAGVSRLLSLAPLRWIGRISYGLYLWHYPLFIWINGARTGLTGAPLFLVRCAVTFAVATLSFYLVEQPIRRGSLARDWRGWAITPIAAIGTVVALVAATAAPAVALSVPTSSTTTTAIAGARPVSVLILGDSTALTLGEGLSLVAKNYDVVENDQGILGCGVAVGDLIEMQGVVNPPGYPCLPTPPPGVLPWPAQWVQWLHRYHPNVVLFLAGRWEVPDRTYRGHWTDILNPTYASYVKSQLQTAVNVATSQGARMVMLTAPCYDSGEQPNGQPWPEDQLARVLAYNKLVREVVSANPEKTSLLDLYSMVCPGGHFESTIDGVTVRSPDGIHFSVEGGILLAPKIWPTVVSVGRAQMAAGAPS
jgi:peptidoglycan/LPS O-acetylase OafA/YrhL